MMEADRILFVASAIHTHPEPLTYPERLRLCIELERIALVVRRMERQLDEVLVHAQSEVALLRPAKPPAKPRLRAIAGGRAEFGM
jgi:hypothetical protein